VGLDDTPTSGQWSPANTAGTDLVKVSENVYDQGGIGDSNLTQVTVYPGGSAAPRVTQFAHDWRNRAVASKGGVQVAEDIHTQRPLVYFEYDNLDQVIVTETYDSDGSGLVDRDHDGVPDKPAANRLRAKATSSYDEQGRVYRSQVYSVDPVTGNVSSNALITNLWYDRRDNVLKVSSPGGLVSKARYDCAGQVTSPPRPRGNSPALRYTGRELWSDCSARETRGSAGRRRERDWT
jgi:YD repeat-containing protein